MLNNRITAYKRTFSVSQKFSLAKLLDVLAKDDFLPFILYPTTVSTTRCRLKSHHVLYPLCFGRNIRITDGIILSECIVEWDKNNRKLILKPSMSILSAIFLLLPFPFLILGSALAKTISEFIIIFLICLFGIGIELIIYYRDKSRHKYIENIAKAL
jgi:hypothetical protein